MAALDVFRADAFGMVQLTNALNKMPYVPKRLGQLGLFKKQGISTTNIMVEEQNGKLMIVPNAARGSSPNAMGGRPRSARTFSICHLPLVANVMADDVQNVRSFGSESELQSAVELVNDKLQDMRTNFEATHEFHRIGAIQGILLDADGSTVIYNWFQEFGQTEITRTIDFTLNNGVKLTAHQVRRDVEDALGMDTYTGLRAFVSADLYDKICITAEVKNSYQYTQAQFLRDNQARGEFTWAGITWEEYRGNVPTHAADGSTPVSGPFIPANTARVVPEGTQDVFAENYGPATFWEAVNTKGKPTYAKQERMKFDLGVEIFGQSNPLIMCNRPAVLIKITSTGSPTMLAAGAFGPDGPTDKDIEDLEKKAKESHDLASRTKHEADENAAKQAKRDLEVAKMDREDTEKRKKAENAAKEAEVKEREKAEKEAEKAEHKK